MSCIVPCCPGRRCRLTHSRCVAAVPGKRLDYRLRSQQAKAGRPASETLSPDVLHRPLLSGKAMPPHTQPLRRRGSGRTLTLSAEKSTRSGRPALVSIGLRTSSERGVGCLPVECPCEPKPADRPLRRCPLMSCIVPCCPGRRAISPPRRHIRRSDPMRSMAGFREASSRGSPPSENRSRSPMVGCSSKHTSARTLRLQCMFRTHTVTLVPTGALLSHASLCYQTRCPTSCCGLRQVRRPGFLACATHRWVLCDHSGPCRRPIAHGHSSAVICWEIVLGQLTLSPTHDMHCLDLL